jgi:hypothetical protein
MSVTFPTSVPSYPDTAGGEVLGSAGGGLGLSRILDDYGLDIAAIATKLGTGASTPSANKVLRSSSNGTSVWGAVVLTTDVTGTLPVANGGTGITSFGSGIATFLGTPSSANLRSAVTDETGSGALVFATSPVIVTPTIASFVNAQHDHSNAAGGGVLDGWQDLGEVPTSVTDNGNRSYTLKFASIDVLEALISPGMRLRATRQVAAPTQCTSLNGTTQYWSDSSVSGMTVTDDFAVSAWVKLSSYPAAGAAIASRYNGTSGWILYVESDGRVVLSGYNAGAGNYSRVISYQSLPLNRWVHIGAQLDMSAFTATTTTSYVMFDGVDVPASVARAGTNPTALVQAGNLEIGAYNAGAAGSFFPGKIAQVAIYSAKVTQATIRASRNQTLTGSETSLISAYTLSGANGANDLNTTNGNNLTGVNSPSTSNVGTPFSGDNDGSNIVFSGDGLTEMGIVTRLDVSFNGSDFDTDVTVQVPEGYAIPTSGGIAAISYSTHDKPHGFPCQEARWIVGCYINNVIAVAITSVNNWFVASGAKLSVPIGEWDLSMQGEVSQDSTAGSVRSAWVTIATTTPAAVASARPPLGLPFYIRMYNGASSQAVLSDAGRYNGEISLTAAANYFLYGTCDVASGTETWSVRGDNVPVKIEAKLAYL